MKIVSCAACSAQISDAATSCPKCHVPRGSNIGHCRTCNTVLPVSKHRSKGSALGAMRVVDGHGVQETHSWIQHHPCPQCGDPKPLYQAGDDEYGKQQKQNWWRVVKLLAWGGVVVVVGSYFILWVALKH